MMARRAVRTVARTAVIAGTASAVSGAVHHRQQKRWNQQYAESQQAAHIQQMEMQQRQMQQQMQMQQQQIQQQQMQQAPAAPQPAAAGEDLIARLEELGRLHASGVLDDAEFAAAKAQLIGGG
jgi:hypothetical protein